MRALLLSISLLPLSLLVVACPGTAEGEGEGAEGEGDAAEGEGEGDAGEGEGDAGEGEGDAGEGEGEGEGDGNVTWYADVLPIAQQKCQSCHSAGGIGPFDVTDEASVVNNSGGMTLYVAAGLMPPWMPSTACRNFVDQDRRTLTDPERAIFAAWEQAGFPLGNPADAPPDPGPLPGLPPPVTSLAMEAFTPTQPASGGDLYRCFLVDPAFAQDTFITGYDIRPGTASMVHHVLLYGADRAAAQAKDDGDPGVGWDCFGGPGVDGALGVPNTLGAWAPGSTPTLYPTDTGLALQSSEVIVMQIHYNFVNAPAPIPADRTTVELKTAATVARPALLTPLPDQNFSIPPNAVGYAHSQSFPTIGRTVHGWLPHMHTLGKTIKVTSTAAGGDACPLIDIPAWDFHWQQSYFYDGSSVDFALTDQVVLSCTWDNPGAGSTTVTWGENTTDEMCLAYAYSTN